MADNPSDSERLAEVRRIYSEWGIAGGTTDFLLRLIDERGAALAEAQKDAASYLFQRDNLAVECDRRARALAEKERELREAQEQAGQVVCKLHAERNYGIRRELALERQLIDTQRERDAARAECERLRAYLLLEQQMKRTAQVFIEKRGLWGEYIANRSTLTDEPRPTPTTSGEPHPWYGPCDALRPDGGCAECAKALPPTTSGEPFGQDKPELNALLKQSVAAFNAMSPEEQEVHLKAQRESWVRGEMELSRLERETTFMQRPASPPTPADLTEQVPVVAETETADSSAEGQRGESLPAGYVKYTGTLHEPDDLVERARQLFSTWMKTRPADTYQSSIISTEATRLVEMIAAALAAERAAERERCAQICDRRGEWAESKIAPDPSGRDNSGWAANYSLGCDDCAEMIRTLSNQPQTARCRICGTDFLGACGRPRCPRVAQPDTTEGK